MNFHFIIDDNKMRNLFLESLVTTIEVYIQCEILNMCT